MNGPIHKVLCSLNSMLSGLHEKWTKELTGVDSSLKSVGITGQIPQKIVGRNHRRVEVIIHNAGDKILYLAPYTGDVDRSLYSLAIKPEDALFLNSHNYAHLYKGDVFGFWENNAAAESKAMITEFYLSS